MKRSATYQTGYSLFWAFIFVFWFVIFFEPGILVIPFLLSCGFTGLLFACVFISTTALIPKLLYKNKKMFFLLTLFLLNLLVGTILTIVIYKVYDEFWIPNALHLTSRQILYKCYLIPFLFSGTACSFKFWTDKLHTEQRVSLLEKEKLKAELEFLKAQINPHFVFNSLNGIYVQIDQSVEGAKETLARFSELLRYQLYECETEQIAIEREVQYLKNYVELQRIRRTKRYNIKFQYDDNLSGFTVAPILMITLVENAFKHVSNWKDKENLIEINLSRNNGDLLLRVENTKPVTPSTADTLFQSGIGLKNLRRRLAILYPQKHELNIHESDELFTAQLKLSINGHQGDNRG